MNLRYHGTCGRSCWRFYHPTYEDRAYFYIVKTFRKLLWAGTRTLAVIGVLLVLRRF